MYQNPSSAVVDFYHLDHLHFIKRFVKKILHYILTQFVPRVSDEIKFSSVSKLIHVQEIQRLFYQSNLNN